MEKLLPNALTGYTAGQPGPDAMNASMQEPVCSFWAERASPHSSGQHTAALVSSTHTCGAISP